MFGAITDLGASNLEWVEHVHENVSGALPDAKKWLVNLSLNLITGLPKGLIY